LCYIGYIQIYVFHSDVDRVNIYHGEADQWQAHQEQDVRTYTEAQQAIDKPVDAQDVKAEQTFPPSTPYVRDEQQHVDDDKYCYLPLELISEQVTYQIILHYFSLLNIGSMKSVCNRLAYITLNGVKANMSVTIQKDNRKSTAMK
jgi:hypothetical protein